MIVAGCGLALLCWMVGRFLDGLSLFVPIVFSRCILLICCTRYLFSIRFNNKIIFPLIFLKGLVAQFLVHSFTWLLGGFPLGVSRFLFGVPFETLCGLGF